MRVLGVGELSVVDTQRHHGRIKTYGLGSCVGLVVVDRQVKVVGMAHIALPDSIYNQEKAVALPGYFADIAVPYLFRRMRALGSTIGKPGSRTEIKMVGGGMAIDNGIFKIGERNVKTILGILKGYGMAPSVMDVGGSDISRTVEVQASTGKTIVWYSGDRIGNEI